LGQQLLLYLQRLRRHIAGPRRDRLRRRGAGEGGGVSVERLEL
jgi:hypothetical protein